MLAYLSRYTHCVAISDHRLVSADAEAVAFKWKVYRLKRGDRMKVIPLPTFGFIRRFLMHVLPDRFCRIRHDGFLAAADRKEKVARIRAQLRDIEAAKPDQPPAETAPPLTLRKPCPNCGGPMRITETFLRGQAPATQKAGRMLNCLPHTRSPVRRSTRRSKGGIASMPFMRRNPGLTKAKRLTKAPDFTPKTPAPSLQTQTNSRNSNRHPASMPALSPKHGAPIPRLPPCQTYRRRPHFRTQT